MTHYIEVISAARETVSKMLTQRTGQYGFSAVVTTNGGKTAAASRSGTHCVLDMPSLPPDTILTRTEADRMIAYLVHEVCHMLHTDYAAWEVAVSEGHRIRHWTNALEDVRIEAHEMRIGPYKAMRSLLSGLVTHLYAENHTAREAAGTRLGADTLNAPYVLTVLGREANGYDLPIVAPLKNELSPSMRKVLAHALAGVKGCTTTWDCLTLARELVAIEKAIKAQQPKQPQQPQQPQQPKPPQQPQQGQGEAPGDDLDDNDTMRQGDDQGDDQGEAEADDQGDDQHETQQSDQGDGACSEQEPEQGQGDDTDDDQGGHGEEAEEAEEAENDQGDDKEAEQPKTGGMPGGEGGGDNGDGLDTDDDQTGIDPDLNLGNTAETIAAREGKEANAWDPAHRLNSMTSDRRKARDKFGSEGPTARKHLDDMTPKNGVLHGQVARLLVTEARTARTHHETSGRLDRRALVRMRTGAPDVFSRRDYAPGIDTAVMVLIDLSGSMASRIDLARVTAWALANAAESAGGKLCIAGFKGEGAGVTLHYVKDWQQTANQCAGMLCSLIPNQYTPLSAAIIAASRDLSEQTATRRVLIVLTDGQCDLGPSAVQSACSLAADVGVETVGIGMNCEQVVRAFPERYSVNVNDLNQLATTGLGILSRMLEETGARV